MQTPPHDNIGRRTRNALAEIPTRLGMLTVLDMNVEGRHSFNNNVHNTTVNGGLSLQSTGIHHPFLTPSPSPEELVIQQRGRRRIPVTFSPDIDELKKEMQMRDKKDHTPVKQAPGSPCRLNIVLRSTPRKRLLLTEYPDSLEKSVSTSPKKLKTEYSLGMQDEEIFGALKILTNDQLISVIGRLIEKHPQLRNDVNDLMPAPDLRPLEELLSVLKRNIYKSLPRSRLISKTDASAYNRASTHVLAFKKAVLEQGQRFLESKQWAAVMEYFIMAWKIVRLTPLWDNVSHNMARKQCFKTLGTYCMAAMKNGNFSTDQYKHYHSILKSYAVDNEELQLCLKQIDKILSESKKK